MVMTFEEIKANALKNYKPEPKVQFTPVTDYSVLERSSTILGLAIATAVIVFGIIF